MKASHLRRVFNLWPPFLFSGVRVEALTDDFSHARVRLKLRWYNRNYVRTQFGGSLFAMADPFWMIMVMERLGRDYVVWDRAGAIEFVAPGRSDVLAEFRLGDEVIEELRAAAADGSKVLRWFETDIVDLRGAVVARVRKQLYVRLKPRQRPGDGAATA